MSAEPSIARETAVECWPHQLSLLCTQLRGQGVPLPEGSLGTLRTAVVLEITKAREIMNELNLQMRRARHARWRDSLPGLWRERPGVIHHWLHAPTAAWGSAPVLDDAGQQCTTTTAVDQAVRAYWVDQVLRQHALVDGPSCWRLFEQSMFGSFIPTLDWPHHPFTGASVRVALNQMRDGAAPGIPGVPLAVWKAPPDSWMDAVAQLLNLVEAEGIWPAEWLTAYVVMIPKTSGGSRPRDQRPITVLPLLYRVWSKAITLEWAAVLQRAYLGQAALGFRAQSGTLHVAQLLSRQAGGACADFRLLAVVRPARATSHQSLGMEQYGTGS